MLRHIAEKTTFVTQPSNSVLLTSKYSTEYSTFIAQQVHGQFPSPEPLLLDSYRFKIGPAIHTRERASALALTLSLLTQLLPLLISTKIVHRAIGVYSVQLTSIA